MILGGCVQQPVAQHIGERYAAQSGSATPHDPEAVFAQQIAQSALAGSLDTTVGSWRMRGIYTGEANGCRAVAVTNLDLRRTNNYRVCGEQVTLTAGVPPTFPSDTNTQAIRSSVTRAAWTNGQATNVWQGYRIEARVVGAVRADGCAAIQTTVVWQGMLVEQRTDRPCM